jgi:hypothetical protein
MIREIIYKLGNDPKRSMRRFLSGLLLFAIAGGFIALGYYYQYWYQIIGLVTAVPAGMMMAYGYVGLLANRLAQILQRLTK